MIQTQFDAPWHARSYEQLLVDGLPKLIAARLPLADYVAERTGPDTFRVALSVGSEAGPSEAGNSEVRNSRRVARITFEELPAVDAEGLFAGPSGPLLCVPIAEHARLASARVACVGEQLLMHVRERLGQAPADLAWDDALLAIWLPLDRWFHEFLANAHYRPDQPKTLQPLDECNWLSRQVHLRRVAIDRRGERDLITPDHRGLACPVETPEGPNVGYVLSIARGAEIRAGQLQLRSADADDDAGLMLGLAASLIPLLEHNETARSLMGANMYRQWLPLDNSEPAFVQTGNEPEGTAFWCGRNLVTAFVSWGGETFDDGLVISESAAVALGQGKSAQVGDKLANRHGSKGVVSRVLPDAAMPHLPDGTPVDLCYSVLGCHTRHNMGQIREALFGCIAARRGAPVIAPPFRAPDNAWLTSLFQEHGLDENGMSALRDGARGELLERPSTVGPVYWGLTAHRSAPKVRIGPLGAPQSLTAIEFQTLRRAGADAVAADLFHQQNVAERDPARLLDDIRSGRQTSSGAVTRQFEHLIARLSVIGIQTRVRQEGVAFDWAAAQENSIALPEPVAHPWLSGRQLEFVPTTGIDDELKAAIAQLADGKQAHLPESLLASARRRLEAAIADLARKCLQPAHLRPATRVLLSARGVMVPGPELDHDCIAIDNEMAWALYGPLIEQSVGEAAIAARNASATRALDTAMAERWLVLIRAPAFSDTAAIAFRATRTDEPVIRIPLQAAALCDGDFDGDQVGIFLPLSEAAQASAGATLTIAAHLRRDPQALIPALAPRMDALWGLAWTSRSAAGRSALRDQGLGLGTDHVGSELLDAAATRAALTDLMNREGAAAALDALGAWIRFGLEQIRVSGASISAFIADDVALPPPPETLDEAIWRRYVVQCESALLGNADYDDANIGPQLLAVRSGARGTAAQLRSVIAGAGLLTDAGGKQVALRRGVAGGRTAEEFWLGTAAVWHLIAELRRAETERLEGIAPSDDDHLGPIARARRSEEPGVVLAQAATDGLVDRLSDIDSRLFVLGSI